MALPAKTCGDWAKFALASGGDSKAHGLHNYCDSLSRQDGESTGFHASLSPPEASRQALEPGRPMTIDIDSLKANIKRWTLILGVLQITVGCMVGFIPPSAVAWFRGIVMAHIEFTANGVLMVAFAFLVRDLQLSTVALKVWLVLLQIGTWANGAAGVAAAFIGASSKLMPTINEKFPPPGGADNPIVSGSLMLCGVTIMLALLLTLYGLLRSKTSNKDSNA